MIHALFHSDWERLDINGNIEYLPNITKEENCLRNEANAMLFDESNMSQLSTCLLILYLQATHGWSDKSVSPLLKLLQTLLPQNDIFRGLRGKASKILDSLGMRLKNIHAC